MKAAQHSSEILPLAATCLDNALNAAISNAQAAGRVFSPQNWAKRLDSVQGEVLVAGTLAGFMGAIPNGPALRDLVRVPAQAFQARWSAE